MSFIEKNLMQNENVVYRTKMHWAVFIRPSIFLFLSLLFSTGGESAWGFAFLFFLASAVDGTGRLINYKTSEYGITDKRVIIKTGFIKRLSIEVLLGKIEGIIVNQGIFGRIFNYGSIVVGGTGGTKDPFKGIDNPLEFRKKVQEQIETIQNKNN